MSYSCSNSNINIHIGGSLLVLHLTDFLSLNQFPRPPFFDLFLVIKFLPMYHSPNIMLISSYYHLFSSSLFGFLKKKEPLG